MKPDSVLTPNSVLRLDSILTPDSDFKPGSGLTPDLYLTPGSVLAPDSVLAPAPAQCCYKTVISFKTALISHVPLPALTLRLVCEELFVVLCTLLR